MPFVAVITLPLFVTAVTTFPVPLVTTEVAPPASKADTRVLRLLPSKADNTHVALSSV